MCVVLLVWLHLPSDSKNSILRSKLHATQAFTISILLALRRIWIYSIRREEKRQVFSPLTLYYTRRNFSFRDNVTHKSQFLALLHFKNLSIPCSWKEGSCFYCKLPKRRECNTAKTTVRAWGGLGGVALIAGAINSAPPLSRLLCLLSCRNKKVRPPAGSYVAVWEYEISKRQTDR